MATWQRLIRFEDDSGVVRFGEPSLSDAGEINTLIKNGSLKATGLDGSGPFDLQPTGAIHKVHKLLATLGPEDVPIVKCIGLNYIKHSTPFANRRRAR